MVGRRAFATAPSLVHGTVAVSANGARTDHAWIERGGFAYDWQTLARGGEPVALADFYRTRGAEASTRYTATRPADAMGQHGHYGPWETVAPARSASKPTSKKGAK